MFSWAAEAASEGLLGLCHYSWQTRSLIDQSYLWLEFDFLFMSPGRAGDTGWHHQNCPMNESPVSPCEFMFTPLGLFVIIQYKNETDQNKNEATDPFFLWFRPNELNCSTERHLTVTAEARWEWRNSILLHFLFQLIMHNIRVKKNRNFYDYKFSHTLVANFHFFLIFKDKFN